MLNKEKFEKAKIIFRHNQAFNYIILYFNNFTKD